MHLDLRSARPGPLPGIAQFSGMIEVFRHQRTKQATQHTAEDGATIFQQACRLGLEGIVSKRLTAPYRSGPLRDWIKVRPHDVTALSASVTFLSG